MAETAFRRFFEDWRGLDLRQTALTREPGSFQKINNWVRGKAGSLRKRNGYQQVGVPMAFRGLHRYAYAIPDGGNRSELVGINREPWTLQLGTITITPPGGVTLRYSAFWEDNGGTKQFRFRLFNGATPYTLYLGLDYMPGTLPLLDLYEAIGGLAGFSVSVNARQARVDGLQTIPASVGTTTINVLAGHNLAIDTRVDVPDSGANFEGQTWFYTYAVTATSFTVPRNPQQAVTLADGAILGPLAAPISTLGIRTNVTSSTTLDFYWWRPIFVPWTDEYRPVVVDPSNTAPMNSLNIANIAVFTRPNATGDVGEMTRDSGNIPSYINDQPEVANKPFKYDRQNFYRLGIGVDVKTASRTGAGSIAAGTYSWKFLYKMQDQVGNIIRSLPYPAGQVTFAGASVVQVSGTTAVATPQLGTCSKGAYAAGPQVGVNTIVVDTNGTVGWTRPNVDAGDYILFRESGGTPPRLTRRLVTSVVRSAAPYSITIAGAPVTIDDNEPISVGLSVEVYRTEAGGSTFYLAGEYAATPYLATFVDNIADAALGFALEEPLDGEEPFYPPRCTVLCEHQGRLVLSGDTNYPNAVYYSLPNSVEQFNPGFAAFDVPSYDSGQIKALVSDSSVQLALFKDRAYYSIEGDLSTGYLNNNIISEGDMGVSSQAAVQKTSRGYIAVGKSGMFEFKDGQIFDPHIELRPMFTEVDYDFSTSRGAWMPSLRQYRFHTSTLSFIVDFSRAPIFVTTASWPLIGAFSTVEFDNKIFMARKAGNGEVYVEISPLRDSNSVYQGPVINRYIDDGAEIGEFYLEITGDCMGEPSIEKYFLRLKLFSCYVPDEENLFVANTMEAKLYTGLVQGGLLGKAVFATKDFEFATAEVTSSEEKIDSVKAVCMNMEISDQGDLFASPHLSGYELVANLPYQKRDNK